MSTSDLLQRFRTDRSREAMDRLIAEYWPVVLSVCRRYFAQPADAEDAAQETFVKLIRRVDQIHGNVAAWLSATARTTSIDLLRRRNRRAASYDTQVLGEMTARADNAATVSWSMLFERLDEAMASIDPSRRDVIVERFFRQTPLRVLAGQNNTSVATMSRRTAEALRQLGEVFRDMGVEPPDAEALAGWLQRIDPAKRMGNGCDGQHLHAGDWAEVDPMRRFRPTHGTPMPEGWTRPIRVGVMMSWENWRRPWRTTYYSTAEEGAYPLRFLQHPGYELFAVVDPGTSDLGVVERSIREYEVMGGLMHWDSAEDLAMLDVLVAGHAFWMTPQIIKRIHQAVRGGVGLYNESYLTTDPGVPADLNEACEISLASPPMYQYCTPGAHGRLRPMCVQSRHPIIDGLNVGDRFVGPGCGHIFQPAAHANLLVAREDQVRPTYIDAPQFSPMRMPILLTGQLGDGRVIKVNINPSPQMPFHHHPALRGRFATNCFNWLAEPRREQQA
jgi:RNA polymerase sigma factor (sigma-70 family)